MWSQNQVPTIFLYSMLYYEPNIKRFFLFFCFFRAERQDLQVAQGKDKQ